MAKLQCGVATNGDVTVFQPRKFWGNFVQGGSCANYKGRQVCTPVFQQRNGQTFFPGRKVAEKISQPQFFKFFQSGFVEFLFPNVPVQQRKKALKIFLGMNFENLNVEKIMAFNPSGFQNLQNRIWG